MKQMSSFILFVGVSGLELSLAAMESQSISLSQEATLKLKGDIEFVMDRIGVRVRRLFWSIADCKFHIIPKNRLLDWFDGSIQIFEKLQLDRLRDLTIEVRSNISSYHWDAADLTQSERNMQIIVWLNAYGKLLFKLIIDLEEINMRARSTSVSSILRQFFEAQERGTFEF